MQLKASPVISGALLQPLYSMNGKAIMLNSKKKKKKLKEIAFSEDHVVIPMTYISNYVSVQPFNFAAPFSRLL